MCGRFTLRTPIKVVAKAFEATDAPEVEPHYNIAPTQDILTVRQGADGREMRLLKWGLVPSWAKDMSIGARLINARSETVTEKPAFRKAFKSRRCLIPADGFYEWGTAGGRKQPFYIRMRDERLFGFAGLWDRWKAEDGASFESCAIITTGANEVVGRVHDRMPVILHPESYDLWLSEDERQTELRKELLQPYPAEEMTIYPVSALVNSPQNRGAELIKPLPG